MPQLDSLSFFSQIFWFFGTFIVFYIFIANAVIPTISTIFKIRNKVKFIKSTDVSAYSENLLDDVVSNLFLDSKQNVASLHNNVKKWADSSFITSKEQNFSTALNTYVNNLGDTLSKNKV